MFESSGAWKMGLHYLFSIKAIPKVLKEAFSMHYGLVLLVIYTIFIIQIIKKSSNYNFTNNKYTFEKKLFFISTNSLLFCFVTFSNAFYREVFLILAIPYLLANINIFRNILLLLCIKYFFNFIYTIDLNFETFYHIDNIRIYKTHFLTTVFIKGLIDYVLMMFLGSIVLKMNLELLNVYKKPKIEIK